MKPPVLKKSDFVRRYKQGEFGNRSKTWETVDDWLDDTKKSKSNLFHLRNRVAGGETFYNLTSKELYGRLYGWRRHRDWRWQERDKNWYISEMAPHDENLIQGEVQRTPSGLYLRYSTIKGLPMRDVLLKGKHAYLLTALGLLQRYLDTKSYEWLMYLLDEYEDHVVEFSSFSKCWGTIPGMNTVFWEVRRY